MSPELVAQLLNIGIAGVALFLLGKLWSAYLDDRAFMRSVLLDLLEERGKAGRERHKIMKELGVEDSSMAIPQYPPPPHGGGVGGEAPPR